MSNMKDINRSIKDALTELYQERVVLESRIEALEQSDRATRANGPTGTTSRTGSRVIKNRASDGAVGAGTRKLDLSALAPKVEQVLQGVNGNGKSRREMEKEADITSADMSHIIAYLIKNNRIKETTGKERYTRYTLVPQSMRVRAGEGEIK